MGYLLYCEVRKIFIIIELTCPCEENISHWNIVKTSKYKSLVDECKTKGWVHFLVVEVGDRGFAGSSLRYCLNELVIVGRAGRFAVDQAAIASSRSSSWIWMQRNTSIQIQIIKYKSSTPRNYKLKTLRTF